MTGRGRHNKFKEEISHLNDLLVILNLKLSHIYSVTDYSKDFWKQASMIIFDSFYNVIKIDEYMILSLDCNTGSNIIDNIKGNNSWEVYLK